MAAGGSSKVVLVAFLGNFAIAITKLSAALFTGAAAMFAEAIHSFVDSGNQLLMLYGMKRGVRPADERHPFGYGREIYFWSFIVAILLFSIGAGVSIVEGIERIYHPHKVDKPLINFIVLGLSFLFEGYALHAAVKEVRMRARPKESMLCYARRSKDAPLFTVLFEDFAAMAGIIIAAVALFFAWALDIPELDGVASVLIGVLLTLAAVFLAIETKSLLIGEAADPEIVASVKAATQNEPSIALTNEVLTMHLGPEDILVTISVDFHDHCVAGDVEAAISRLEHTIKTQWPQIRRVFIEAQGFTQHHADAARKG
jgi:cation diffusion facilitator family transporter